MTETFFVTMLNVRKFWVNVFFFFFCRFAPLILTCYEIKCKLLTLQHHFFAKKSIFLGRKNKNIMSKFWIWPSNANLK